MELVDDGMSLDALTETELFMLKLEKAGEDSSLDSSLTPFPKPSKPSDEPREFICEVDDCAKSFRSKPDLKKHIHRVHTSRKHMCDICGAGFKTAWGLRKHVKLHGENQISCDYEGCTAQFSTTSMYNKHVHRVHGLCEKKCSVCGRAYGSRKHLNRHIRTSHGIGTVGDGAQQEWPLSTPSSPDQTSDNRESRLVGDVDCIASASASVMTDIREIKPVIILD